MAAKKKRKPTGRKPERLQIEGNWKDAVAHVLKRGKPLNGKAKKRKRK